MEIIQLDSLFHCLKLVKDLHMLQFKFAKNVDGDCRLSMRPENLIMNMFLKYNLRALNYSVESLQLVLETFRYHYSQKRDLRDPDEVEDEKLHDN